MDTSRIKKLLRRIVAPLCILLSLVVSSTVSADFGSAILPGIMLLTGFNLKPLQTVFEVPELADPYATVMPDSVLISGTAAYSLKFTSLDDVRKGGPYKIQWNRFFDSSGAVSDGGWDLKPSLWAASSRGNLHLWNPKKDSEAPIVIWYGGRMRAAASEKSARWPADNYSRDVFAFIQSKENKWVAAEDSIFSTHKDWPRAQGNYLGHRYGHQIVMVPQQKSGHPLKQAATVFYEEVTKVRENGMPQVTKIFMDEMITPLKAKGTPTELISPIDLRNGKFYPSTVREDGSALIEGPIYFRFRFENQNWEGIGFSAGSFYSHYPACFAARKVSDGVKGKPYRIDLNDDGTDLHNAAEKLGARLNMIGGPGRPAVIVDNLGDAVPNIDGSLQLLLHGYRQDILPNSVHYPLDQKFRVMLHANLKIEKRKNGSLRFQVITPDEREIASRSDFAKKLADENTPASIH